MQKADDGYMLLYGYMNNSVYNLPTVWLIFHDVPFRLHVSNVLWFQALRTSECNFVANSSRKYVFFLFVKHI